MSAVRTRVIHSAGVKVERCVHCRERSVLFVSQTKVVFPECKHDGCVSVEEFVLRAVLKASVLLCRRRVLCSGVKGDLCSPSSKGERCSQFA